MCYHGHIYPPKAGRGHATSDSANIEGIVLNVTKNRDPHATSDSANIEGIVLNVTKNRGPHAHFCVA